MAENKGRNKGWDNLKPAKPGEVRNPRGNYKRTPHLATRLKKALAQKCGDKTQADLMLEGGIHAARKGNAGWAKIIFERIDGPIPNVHEGGDPDRPMRIIIEEYTEEAAEPAPEE